MRLPKDPRWFQIGFLSTLLCIGLAFRSFQIQFAQIAIIFAVGLAIQALFLFALELEGVGFKSALITCLSLCLLLRSDRLWVPAACAAAAISSKFLLRIDDKHLFNPGNFGVVFGLLVTGHAWVSPAQWGHNAIFAAWFAMLGATVVWRAARQDVSWAFLFFYLGLFFLRVCHLGQRWAVFYHALENGSLLLFTYFMISDPKTLPDSRAARIAFAAIVAGGAFYWQYGLFRINGLFYVLFALTPTSWLWDRWLQGERYDWLVPKGDKHGLPTRAALIAGVRP